MAETLTQQMERPKRKDCHVLKLQFLAGVSGSLATHYIESEHNDTIIGKYCLFAITDPGSTTAPTDNYDITVNDSFGCDIFGGELVNRASGSAEQAVPKVGNTYGPRLVTTGLSIAFSGNTANNASGTVYIVFVE